MTRLQETSPSAINAVCKEHRRLQSTPRAQLQLQLQLDECAQQKDTFYSHWATHSSILRRTRAEGLPVSAESTENLVMPDDAPAMTSSDDLHQLEQVIYPLIRHTSDPRPRSLTSSRPRSLTSSPPPPRRQNGLRMSYGLRQTAAFGSGGPADSDEDYQKTGGIVSTWRASCRSACGPGEFQTEDTLQPTVG